MATYSIYDIVDFQAISVEINLQRSTGAPTQAIYDIKVRGIPISSDVEEAIVKVRIKNQEISNSSVTEEFAIDNSNKQQESYGWIYNLDETINFFNIDIWVNNSLKIQDEMSIPAIPTIEGFKIADCYDNFNHYYELNSIKNSLRYIKIVINLNGAVFKPSYTESDYTYTSTITGYINGYSIEDINNSYLKILLGGVFTYNGYNYSGLSQVIGATYNNSENTSPNTIILRNLTQTQDVGDHINIVMSWSKIPTIQPPSAPTNLSHSSTNNYRYSSSNNITYKWTGDSKATSYHIRVEGVNCSHSPNYWDYNTTNINYSDYFTSKHVGESFRFKVEAINSAGNAWSSYSSNFTIKGYYSLQVEGSEWKNITASSFNPSDYTPTAPAGKVFDGWYTKATGGNKYTSTITFNSSTPSITAYAHFVNASSSKITLNGNGGKFNGATTTTANLDSNNRWKVTNLPTRTGYTCPGYGKTAETTTVSYKYNTTYPFTNNQTIYAVWKQDGTITYDLNAPKSVKDGTSLTVSPTSIPSGKKVYNVTYNITTTTPEIDGYTFNGWKKDSTIYQPGASYTTNGDATLTAQWTGKSYKYKYIQPSPGPSLTLPSAGTYTYNSTFTFPNITSPITVEDGSVWRHTGWNVKNGEEETVYSGTTFPFLYSNNNTQLQTQWRKDTGWSVANIWIYAPEGNVGNEIEFNDIDLTLEEE